MFQEGPESPPQIPLDSSILTCYIVAERDAGMAEVGKIKRLILNLHSCFQIFSLKKLQKMKIAICDDEKQIRELLKEKIIQIYFNNDRVFKEQIKQI